MKKTSIKIAALLVAALLFCGVKTIFSQEWENVFEYNNDDNECIKFNEVKELSDGNIGVASSFYYRSGYGDFYSGHPCVVKLSSDGTELSKNHFYKTGYTGTSRAPFLFENNDGELFALTTYGPDHDYTYFNYFKNFDNPPTDAIIGLYKLDESLQIEKIFEHSYPIDTFEFRGDIMWESNPNETSGNIFIISAFEDEGDIVGAYIKSVSKSPDNSRGNDSLFFFRMNFEGEFLHRKAYELGYGGATLQTSYRRNHIIKTDNHYMLYSLDERSDSESIYAQGTVRYYDLDFNYITKKFIDCENCGGYSSEYLYNIAVKRSDHNTTYLVSDKKDVDNIHYNDCRLYEINDDINTVSDNLTIERYCDRGTEEWDRSASLCGVDIADDNTIFFAYELYTGYITALNSYSMIERLNSEFGSISTLYYDISEDKEIATGVCSIHVTEDQGVIICGSADDINSDTDYYYITKFPASAFVSIEEAHAHNLKVAVAYPNPGGDVMNIRTSLRNCTLQVYDMQGRLVHKQEVTDDVTSVDASNWQRGTYIWELKMENGKLKVEEGKWVK